MNPIFTRYTDTIWTIDHFISPETCQKLIDKSEGVGFEDAPITTWAGPVMRKDVRDNTRVIIDDQEWSDQFWSIVRPYVPSTYVNTSK